MFALVFFGLLAVSHSQPVGVWVAPGPGDARSPCPGLNTLANHGYLPRNGRNITGAMIQKAAFAAYSLGYDVTLAAVLNGKFVAGLFPGGVMSALWNLNATHDVLEHDASLTREDAALGDYIRANATLVNEYTANQPDGLIKQSDIAQWRSDRINLSRARNPDFMWKLTAQQPVSATESALMTTYALR